MDNAPLIIRTNDPQLKQIENLIDRLKKAWMKAVDAVERKDQQAKKLALSQLRAAAEKLKQEAA